MPATGRIPKAEKGNMILIMLYSQKRLSVTGNSGNWRLKRTWSRALLNFSA